MVQSKIIAVTQVQQAQVEAKNLRRTRLGRQMTKTNQTGRQMMEFYQKRQQVMQNQSHPDMHGAHAPIEEFNKHCEDCVDMNCVWDKINKCSQEHDYTTCEQKHICENEKNHQLWYEQSCQWSRGDGCWQDLYCDELPIRKQINNCQEEAGHKMGQWAKCEREHKCQNHEFMAKQEEHCNRGNDDVCWQVSWCEEIDFHIQTEECLDGDWNRYEECEYKHKCQEPQFLEVQDRKCQKNEWDCWMITRCEELENKFGKPARQDDGDCRDVMCIDDRINNCAQEKNHANDQWMTCRQEILCDNAKHVEVYDNSRNCEWDKNEGYQCWIHSECIQGGQNVQVQQCVAVQTDNHTNWHTNAWEQCELDEKCSDEALMTELQHMCESDPSHRNQCWPVEHCQNIPLQMQVNECTNNGGDWEECEHQHKCQSGEFLRRQENKCQKDEWNCWERDNCERLNEKFGVPAPPMPQRDHHDHYPHDNQGQQQIPHECVEQVHQFPECQEQPIVQDCLQGEQQQCHEIEEYGPPRECEHEEIGRACGGEDDHHHEHHHGYHSEEFHYHSEEFHHNDEFHYHSEEYYPEEHYEEHYESFHHDDFHNEYDSFHHEDFHNEYDSFHHEDFHNEYDSFHYEEPMDQSYP